MFEAAKQEERELMNARIWEDETKHRFQWALISVFPCKVNGDTGWRHHIEKLLGPEGQEWVLGNYQGYIKRAADYEFTTQMEWWDEPAMRCIVIYCDHTLDSIQVLERLIDGDKSNFTPSLLLGFKSPQYLDGEPWQDHIITKTLFMGS
jgi:hypothetical protein